MKTIDTLHEWCNFLGDDPCDGCAKQLHIIADEIEAEIERDYMRLPVDADGVPIHVGDDLRSASSKTEYTALGFWFDFDCDIWQVMVSSKQAMSGNMLRHVKPRTLEDVLVDMLEAAIGYSDAHTDVALVAVEKYADEIRELLGSDV